MSYFLVAKQWGRCPETECFEMATQHVKTVIPISRMNKTPHVFPTKLLKQFPQLAWNIQTETVQCWQLHLSAQQHRLEVDSEPCIAQQNASSTGSHAVTKSGEWDMHQGCYISLHNKPTQCGWSLELCSVVSNASPPFEPQRQSVALSRYCTLHLECSVFRRTLKTTSYTT